MSDITQNLDDLLIYDSREPLHKRPFGACPNGAAVEVSFGVSRFLGRANVKLIIYYERPANERITLDMVAAGQFRDLTLFTASITTTNYTGLLWYFFEIECRHGLLYYGAAEGRRGGRGQVYYADPAPAYMLLVYDKDTRTPAWYGEGVTYHIFADRFARTRLPDAADYSGRVIHGDWHEPPHYLPNAAGKITNDDFYGGDLKGIESKLDYLEGLGVTTIYLSPIFAATQNHRYNTADYRTIDPMLGDEADFVSLCANAAARGMRVMLDGVFSHTGDDSVYFNARGTYGEGGAAKDKRSPYFSWYHFDRWPDEYTAWWGVPTLPETNEDDPGFVDYIISGGDSVVKHWTRLGASGWRLDVADELPDGFIQKLRRAVREERPDAVVVGEVWEDAAEKISHGGRREYFYGSGLDGVMNYPLRDAIVVWLRGGPAGELAERIMSLCENYPRHCFHSLMNILGTHDTARILTMLGYGDGASLSRAEKAAFTLDEAARERAKRLLTVGSALLMCLPGSPCIYYGDEAGMEGFGDPFNRACYPWGREDAALIEHYRKFIGLRKSFSCLRRGDIRILAAEGGLIAVERCGDDGSVYLLANASARPQSCVFACPRQTLYDAFTREDYQIEWGRAEFTLAPYGVMALATHPPDNLT